LSPSESAGLGWGGPHSLRWEGGSALVLHPRPSPSSRAVTHTLRSAARASGRRHATPHSSACSRSRSRSCRICGEHGARAARPRGQRAERDRFALRLLDRHDAAAPRAVERHLLTRATARDLACTHVHAHAHRATSAQVATLAPRRAPCHTSVFRARARGRRPRRGFKYLCVSHPIEPQSPRRVSIRQITM